MQTKLKRLNRGEQSDAEKDMWIFIRSDSVGTRSTGRNPDYSKTDGI